ncbi:hypothetical protein AB0C29_02860 [Actinoplanes sp. NPDC048791]|uniref:hypothetical protein n=1 Tax=Actinoplanes sp. NPDC048791 TaxID=3154623 RepID=UPI0033C8198F
MTSPHQRTSSHQHVRPPTPSPFPEDPTTATRHLCAGAYLDDDFRNAALRWVYYQSRRIVAPSYGFDVVPVLAHCLRARNGAILRDIAIVVTVLIAASASMLTLFLALSMLVQLQIAVATYRLARDTFRALRNGDSVSLGTLGPRTLLLFVGWSVFSVVSFMFAFALIKNSVEDSPGVEGLGQADLTETTVVAGGMWLTSLIILFSVGFSLWRQAELARLTPNSELTVPADTARLDEIARQQRGNTTVYGDYEPFIGSGVIVDSWSFAQRLVRAQKSAEHGLGGIDPIVDEATENAREFQPMPFQAHQLIEYVKRCMHMLVRTGEAEEQIPGLTVEDRIYLAGTEVSQLAPFTPGDVVAAIIRHPTTPARHYLTCQVFSWGGEIITTVHVHIAVQGRSLYLESTTTALPPCRREYRVVDTAENNGPMAWLRTIKDGFIDAPRSIWRAPINLAAAVINLVAGSAGGSGEQLRLERGYDYGARIAIREIGMEQGARVRAQIQDVVKYQKLIERRMLASVLDFLDAQGVDTTEYRDRASSILNVNGGMVTFGGEAKNYGTVHGANVQAGPKS